MLPFLPCCMHPVLHLAMFRQSAILGGAMVTWRPRIHRWQGTLAAFLLLVGFLLVVQLRTGRTIRQEVELPTVRVRDLAVLVQQQEEALQSLQSEVERLRQKLSEYATAGAQGRSSAETLAREVDFYKMVLGLTAVHGPGVVVRLREGSTPGSVVAPTVQPHDLSGLVNELWSSGAEAVAVNGIRILATTGFKQGDDRIVAGTFLLRPPYEIQGIGDPASMKATLGLRGGFVEGLRSVGLEVEVVEMPSLTLPPYKGPLMFRRATPAPP